ncbi:MAG: hypothetical protein ABW160_03620 [Candidatus Thiodiazotropha sp. 4PDIV1]
MNTSGKSLSLEVLAEGIETEKQQLTLVAEGCHIGQGYLLSQPLNASDMEEAIHQSEQSEQDISA